MTEKSMQKQIQFLSETFLPFLPIQFRRKNDKADKVCFFCFVLFNTHISEDGCEESVKETDSKLELRISVESMNTMLLQSDNALKSSSELNRSFVWQQLAESC